MSIHADHAIQPQLRELWITRFDFLGGALPGREAPTDIDQACEKNGHFLFIECKRPYQPITRGQQIFFDRLVALSPRIRLLVVVGHPPDQIIRYGWWGKPLQDGDVWEVRDLVARWRAWAVKQ
jgi:hypothetical protein